MVQILRVDNPLFARGLSVPQRLCYLNAMLHFLYALPRLIFLTAPILYLVFGKLNIPGYWLAILVFAVPHLVIANVINSRVQGYRRYSFWNEIYETVLSPYILLPTLFALISPKFGKFNVTAKGQNLQEDSFDGKLARPFLVLLALNAMALLMAVPRYLYWDNGHAGTVVMNVIWTLFNMVVLTVALSACWESRQRRQSVRVSVAMPLQVKSQGQVVAGMVRDLSVSGASFTAAACPWQPGDEVEVNFPMDDATHVHVARIVGIERGRTRIEFQISSIAEQESITRLLYLASDRWVDWTDGREPDSILGSLAAVFLASLTGVGKMSRLVRRKEGISKSAPAAIRTASVILVLLASSAAGLCDRHKVAAPAAANPPTTVVRVGLDALGAHDGILLNDHNRNQAVDIALPENLLIEAGVLHLKYTLPQAKEAASTLEVLLNDLLIASITPSGLELARGKGEIAIPLPPEQMVRQNRITLQLANNPGDACSLAESAKAPIHIDADSDIELREQRLVLANELSLLPAPFAQRSSAQLTNIPVVFGHAPDKETLQAAGVLASWFGSLSIQGDTRFETSLGTLPEGNAVLVLLGDDRVGGVGGDPSGENSPQSDRSVRQAAGALGWSCRGPVTSRSGVGDRPDEPRGRQSSGGHVCFASAKASERRATLDTEPTAALDRPDGEGPPHYHRGKSTECLLQNGPGHKLRSSS
jgi:cellulose synthase (UDP-forming)